MHRQQQEESPPPNKDEDEETRKEYNSLVRVLHRLVQIDKNEQLSSVLQLLLPRLLTKMGLCGTKKVQMKYIEIFGHLMKRIRYYSDSVSSGEENILQMMDCLAIVNGLLTDTNEMKDNINVYTLNLSLSFLNLGIPLLALSPKENNIALLQLLPKVLMVDHFLEPTKKIPHLLLTLVEGIVTLRTVTNNDLMDSTIRPIVSNNGMLGEYLYALFSDVLLYQSKTESSSSTPPPGLSQNGLDRLHHCGTSNNNSMFDVPLKLKSFQLAILDLIAPTQPWKIFSSSSSMGVARMISLFVIATTDSAVDLVSTRAKVYLKSYLDSLKDNLDGTVASLTLIWLLSLCLGETPTISILQRYGLNIPVLGSISFEGASSGTTIQEVMKKRKTQVSNTTITTVLSFLTKHVLDTLPKLLFISSKDVIEVMGSLVIALSSIYLTTTTTVQSSLKVNTACAKFLNSCMVRYVTYYNSLGNDKDQHWVTVRTILAKAMQMACCILSSNTTTNRIMKKDWIDLKDSCYGIVCILCRSQQLVQSENGWFLFDCGTMNASKKRKQNDTETATTTTSNISIGTALLLFNCLKLEVTSNLGPRAIAALDALLGSYKNVYASTTVEDCPVNNNNPWQQQALTQDKAIIRLVPPKSLLPLLWNASRFYNRPKASRLAATRWTLDLLKPFWSTTTMVHACHLLCYLAGDEDVGVSKMAQNGLLTSAKLLLLEENDEDEGFQQLLNNNDEIKNEKLPDFQDFVRLLFNPTTTTTTTSNDTIPTYNAFTYKGQAATLQLGLTCLFSDLYRGGDDDDDGDAILMYLSTITSTLQHGSTTTIHTKNRELKNLMDAASNCLAGCLSTSKLARTTIIANSSTPSSFGLEEISKLAISADSSLARRHLASACGSLYEDLNIWSCPKITRTISSSNKVINMGTWVELSNIILTMKLCASKLDSAQSSNDNHHPGAVGGILGAASLGSKCVRVFRIISCRPDVIMTTTESISSCWEYTSSILSSLGRGSLHLDDAVGNACARGITIAFSYNGEDAPILDKRLYTGTSKVLVELCAALKKYGGSDHTDAIRASLLAKAAGVTLAASSTAGVGLQENDDPSITKGIIRLGNARLQCVESLFDLLGSAAFQKHNEISLVTGEALAHYADAYSPEGAVWSRPMMEERPETYIDSYATELPPHQHVIYVLFQRELKATSPHKRTACATTMLALVGRVARKVNSNTPAVRSRFFVTEILNHLTEFQGAFLKLLTDPKNKHLSRESCCLGLAACRGIAIVDSKKFHGFLSNQIDDGRSRSDDLNERLLRAFGQTTNYSGSVMMETRSQNNQRLREENRVGNVENSQEFVDAVDPGEIGGVSGVGEAALGAYKEMAGVSMSIGRPDILYSLLVLSVTHPIWSMPKIRNHYNAASLLGEKSETGVLNSSEIRQVLRPHLGRLIPRLLRACNDPTKQTREQMTAVWIGLTGGGTESRLAISQHLHSTIDTLINDASNKLWRARVGACSALSEVIVGRNWDDLGGGEAVMDDEDVSSKIKASAGIRLLRLWRVTTRALDDVRLTVRESGEVLSRSVRSLTLRLCDPSLIMKSEEVVYLSSTSRDSCQKEADANAASAAATALRWLVQNGLNQSCAEATGFCVSCLLCVVDVAKPATLQPVLPELIGSLVMAMSGLEPAALNYLQVRAEGTGYDRLERIRLQMAQVGPIYGALAKCLDMMRMIRIDTQKEVIPQLDSAIRIGSGFATRSAAADTVATLCSTCPLAFKFVGYSTANPTVRLLRALYYASERERGNGAKEKMAHALGSLADLAPGNSVRVLALRACERYTVSVGSNNDPAVRRASAAALRAIALRASSQFTDGGSNDIWCKRVLPIAFLGRKDEDIKVAVMWKDVWEEGGSATNIVSKSTTGCGFLLQEKLLPYLVRACIDGLNDVSWSRRVNACDALIELIDINVLAPVPKPIEAQNASTLSDEVLLCSRRRAQASNEVLATCVRLLVRRLWSGKAKLVKTTVKLASNWTSLGMIDNNTDWNQYGWNCDEVQSCPWIPIVHHRAECCDLLSGDRWFDNATTEENDKVTPISVEPDETDDLQKVLKEQEEESTIDFDEGDKILAEKYAPTVVVRQDEGNCKYTPVVFTGLCRALLQQSITRDSPLVIESQDALPFRAACLDGLSELLLSVEQPAEDRAYDNSYSKRVYHMLAPQLITQITDSFVLNSHSPLLISGFIKCLSSAMWEGMGHADADVSNATVIHSFESISMLSELLLEKCGKQQPAWTVREESALACANLCCKAISSSLRKHETLSTLLDCAAHALKDKKIWRVRLAGLKLVHSLISRTASGVIKEKRSRIKDTDSDKTLMLEALLSKKEVILKLVKVCLADNEAKVTAIATEICSAASWWP